MKKHKKELFCNSKSLVEGQQYGSDQQKDSKWNGHYSKTEQRE